MANFSYDDVAGNTSLSDDISAELPVIDLTAAFNANDIWIQITTEYTFRNSNDDLDYEYWNTDALLWIPRHNINPDSFNTVYKTCSNLVSITNFFVD